MENSFVNFVDHTHKTNINIFKGIIYLDKLLDYLKITFAKADYNDQNNILIDISEAELPDFLKNMDILINFMMETSGVINWKRKCAIVTSKPHDVVIGEMLKLKLTEINFDLSVEVFSSREAALYWM